MPLRRVLSLATLACLFVAGFLAARLCAADAPATYAARIDAARDLADTGFHDRALTAYREALPLVPDETQRRWCRLWILTEELAVSTGDSAVSQDVTVACHALLAPYAASNLAPDAFWLATRDLLAAAAEARDVPVPNLGLSLRLETLRLWGAQPPSPAATEALAAGALKLGNSLRWARDHTGLHAEALDFLRQAAAAVGPGATRAQLLLLRARALRERRDLEAGDFAMVDAAFDAALAAARGTTREVDALVERAHWRVLQSQVQLTRRGAPPPGASPATEFIVPAAAMTDLLAIVDETLATAAKSPPSGELPAQVQMLKGMRAQLATPSLGVTIARIFLPDSRVAFDLTAQHVSEVEYTLHRVPLDEIHDYVRGPFSEAGPLRLPTTAPFRTWTLSTGLPPGLGRAFRRYTWNEALAPGGYLLVASNPADRSQKPALRFFLVSRARAIATPAADGFIEVWAYDQVTGQPLPAVGGSVRHGGVLRPLVSAADGPARVSLADWALDLRQPVATTLVGSADGHPFLLPLVQPGSMERESWRFHLNTDRQLYLPGETAQWKLTARTLVDGQLTVPTGEKFKITAKTDRDVVLGTWETTLGRFGTAAGKLDLSASVGAGQVSFRVERTGLGTPVEDEVNAFVVDRFRPPEADLTLAPPDPGQIRAARAGRDVELELTARYFSGEPVVSAPVSVVASFVGRNTPFDEPERKYSAEDLVFPSPLNLEVVTDARGRALVRFSLPTGLPKRFSVTALARLSGEGHHSEATFVFHVSPEGYRATLASSATPKRVSESEQLGYINPSIPRLYAAPGQPMVLTLSTRDGSSAPVAARGKLVVQRVTWAEVWRTPAGDLLTGPALHERQGRALAWPPPAEDGWQRLHADDRIEEISAQAVATDADGRSLVQLSALPSGCYRVLYHDGDPAKSSGPLARLDLFVADEQTTQLALRPAASGPVIIPCEAAPAPGQPIRALVILPSGGRDVLLQCGGVSTGITRREKFSGNARLVEFPWHPSYWAGVRVAATAFDSQAHPTTVELTPSRDSHALHIRLDSPAAVRPGEKARVTLRTTDATGQPVPAEIALAVADDSLAALNPLDRTTPAEVFLARGRLPSAHVDTSAKAEFLGPRSTASLTQAGPPQPEPLGEADDSVMMSARMSDTASRLSAKNVADYAPSPTVAGADSFDRISSPTTRTRSQFSYTATWQPEIETDVRGGAAVEFTYPDNLTTWRFTAEAVGEGHRFGREEITARSTLPLQARLRAPRALVAGDTVSILGALVNGTAQPVSARAELSSRAGHYAPEPAAVALTAPAAASATVPAGGETVLAWTARAREQGPSTLHFAVAGGGLADASELLLPVREDGFERITGVTGRADGQTLARDLVLPAGFHPARTHVAVHVSPGIVPALLDALPYLVDYPYGCVEQTVSRFLPAALVVRFLRDLGFTREEMEGRLHVAAPSNPAASGDLDTVIARSLDRLQEARLPNGAFGWFPGGEPDVYMTAYVLRGLNLAAAAQLSLPAGLREGTRAAVFALLEERPPELADSTTLAWVLFTAAGCPETPSKRESDLLAHQFDALYARRPQLSASGLALLASVARALGRDSEAQVLRRDLAAGVTRATSQEFGATAHWGRTAGYFSGFDGAVESTALALTALLALDPADPLVDAAATWLLVNRTSGRWSNTRDTALAFFALHDYARARGDTRPTGSYRLLFNGQPVAEGRFDRASLLQPTGLLIDRSRLQPGANRLTLEPAPGTSPCYLAAIVYAWTSAEGTAPAGDFIKVTREFSRLVESPTLLGNTLARPQPLSTAGGRLARNEQLECRLILELKHPLEYLAIESPKPAGGEPLNPLSGWDATLRPLHSGNGRSPNVSPRPVYREEHDDRSVFFLPRLDAGRWEIRYTLRAAFSGDFRVLPATASAMYVPAISAHSEARRLTIADKVE